MKNLFATLALPCALLAAPLTGWAGNDHDHPRYRDSKQTFWDGPCKVKREWKKNGGFEEKRECQGLYAHAPQHKHKEKFRDGPCKVEREWKKNGDYQEKRECKGR